MSEQYEAVIGLEVHCQLATDSKSFSADAAVFDIEPNVHIDPLTIGHPGTLPVYNAKAVAYTLKMGLATHSQINQSSIFARKHYFYPDLPKGYQISQYDRPICSGGYVKIETDQGGSSSRAIGLTRIHVEEDAGKSIHSNESDFTRLDYNRSGVPLIEIVSEPEIRSPREAYHYMRKIRQLVRYLDICDGNMEQGSLRCDANVSVRKKGESSLGRKTEIKNLNSFRFLEKALEYEIQRQIDLVANGQVITSETRLWDQDAGQTRSMRSKEEAHDYRYFPDPDLPPLVVSNELLDRVKGEMPALPDTRVKAYVDNWNLPRYDAGVITAEREVAEYFEASVEALLSKTDYEPASVAKAVSNFLMTHVLNTIEISPSGDAQFPISPARLAELIDLRLHDDVSSTSAVALYSLMAESNSSARDLAAEHDLIQVQDIDTIDRVIDEVLAEHPENVSAYRGGKLGLIGFFIGAVMKSYPGSPDPKLVRSRLEEKLSQVR